MGGGTKNVIDTHFTCADGVSLAATLYEPEPAANSGSSVVPATIIVASAVGVPRQFYRHFAQWLCDRGYRALSFDYRGVGGSTVEYATMADWGQLDIQAAIQHCKQWPEPLILLGHSAGGQLPGLAANVWDVKALACVAASAPNVRHYAIGGKLKLVLAWYLIAPLLGRLRSRFPARRLGLSSTDIPSGVMREWARWGRASQYLFTKKFGFDLRRYQALKIPLVSFSFTDDNLASRAAVEALFPHYPCCQLADHYLSPEECAMTKIGHMGFFHPDAQSKLWPILEGWMQQSALRD